MIFEKAWAKLHGSYESIEGGETEDALQYLTGGLASLEKLDDDAEALKWAFLHQLLGETAADAGFCSCFLKPSFGGGDPAAVRRSHPALSIRENAHEVKRVRLRVRLKISGN